MTALYEPVTHCRICGGESFLPVVDLGTTPLANALVDPERVGEPELAFPLAAIRCVSCGLVQLSVVVHPEIMFRHYLYSSSASQPLLAHFDAYAEEVTARYASPGSLVVEVGSNDGVLLAPFARRQVRVLGIEPSTNIAAIANRAGLETWSEFFEPHVARRAVRERGEAAAVVANNVLAHIHDLGGVLEALDVLLAPAGVFVAEVPYLADLLAQTEFDTIYHEHLSYFALRPLKRLLEQGGLELFDVRHLPVHGGSIRIFAGRPGRHQPTPELAVALAAEDAAGLDRGDVYAEFAERVVASRDALVTLLSELRAAGKSVAALGATAKGNTLLNYCGVRSDLIAFVADTTALKHGRLTPGMHIPIRPERAILDERPDYTLLLAWNYAATIIPRFAAYIGAGGRFIHPMPIARIVGP